MTSTDTAAAPPAGSAQSQPQFRVLAQYVKDLSFENPNAPSSLIQRPGKPDISVRVDINTRRLSGDQFETELRLQVEAKQENEVQFIIDLLFAGLFLIQGVPVENLEPVLVIECPRLLFPFARRVISDASRDGGFMPLNIEPVDFAAVYRMQLERRAMDNQAGIAEGGYA
ncbi:MAG: protein-export chaperone SecB [Alphaproteobacteria bacterium]